jgi:hypothetical protein
VGSFILVETAPAALGWSGVAFDLIFTLAFGYFRFIRSEAA